MESKDSTELKKVKPNLTNFRIFLTFMKGDTRISDAFRWSFSIDAKITSIGILYEEVLTQIPKCLEEFRQTEERGFGEAKESLILSTKFENFLNSIYALCENLSNIVHQLYRNKVPMRFDDQRKKLLKNRTIDAEYSGIVEKIDWYDEVHSLRSEATHFLSGLIGIPSPTQLGYYNFTKSQGVTKEIKITDIEKFTKELYHNVMIFVSSYGDHFVKIIEQDSIISQICYIVPKVGIGCRKISLRDAVNGQAGICATPNFDCPKKSSCQARQKRSI